MTPRMKLPSGAAKALKAHKWKPEKHSHYVEPEWCDRRLFDVERFDGAILDPCCGFGRIPKAAIAAGYEARGTDLVYRGYGDARDCNDFLTSRGTWPNLVFNSPYHLLEEFTMKAMQVARRKIAMLWLVRRMNAAHYLRDCPVSKIYLLTPRPSMPGGRQVAKHMKKGTEPSGGLQDFCWIVIDKAYSGYPRLDWLHRDGFKDD